MKICKLGVVVVIVLVLGMFFLFLLSPRVLTVAISFLTRRYRVPCQWAHHKQRRSRQRGAVKTPYIGNTLYFFVESGRASQARW